MGLQQIIAQIQAGETEVHASRVKWTSEEISQIAQAATANPSLKVLWLDNCELTDACAIILAEAIQRGSKLEVIWLLGNKIQDEGARAFATALVNKLSLLRELHLSFNKIGDVGAHALATALLSPICGLESLDLSCNQIGDEGAHELALALEGNSSLKVLCLGGNKIKENGETRLDIARKSSSCALFGVVE